MDNLAARGHFAWRTSFVPGLNPGNDAATPNATFTQILNWALETYDVSVGKWRNLPSRKADGVVFPLGHVDASVVMMQKPQSNAFDPYKIFKPSTGLFGL